jgi:hypothetical protein
MAKVRIRQVAPWGFPVKTGIHAGMRLPLRDQAEEVASETTSEGSETVEGFHGEDNT